MMKNGILWFVLLGCFIQVGIAQQKLKPSFGFEVGNNVMNFKLTDPGGLVLASIPQAESAQIYFQVPIPFINTYLEPCIGYNKVGVDIFMNSPDFDTVKHRKFYPNLNTTFALGLSRQLSFLNEKIVFRYGAGAGFNFNLEPNDGALNLHFKNAGYLTTDNLDTSSTKAMYYTENLQGYPWNTFFKGNAALEFKIGKLSYLTLQGTAYFARLRQLRLDMEYATTSSSPSRNNKATLEYKGSFYSACIGLKFLM